MGGSLGQSLEGSLGDRWRGRCWVAGGSLVYRGIIPLRLRVFLVAEVRSLEGAWAFNGLPLRRLVVSGEGPGVALSAAAVPAVPLK